MENEKKTLKLHGMEWQIFAFFDVIIIASMLLGIIPNQLVGAIAVMFNARYNFRGNRRAYIGLASLLRRRSNIRFHRLRLHDIQRLASCWCYRNL